MHAAVRSRDRRRVRSVVPVAIPSGPSLTTRRRSYAVTATSRTTRRPGSPTSSVAWFPQDRWSTNNRRDGS